jgi:hypothetical protein
VVEHISVNKESGAAIAANACETVGASDAIRIAKHAIQAVKRLVDRLIPMAGFYHRHRTCCCLTQRVTQKMPGLHELINIFGRQLKDLGF